MAGYKVLAANQNQFDDAESEVEDDPGVGLGQKPKKIRRVMEEDEEVKREAELEEERERENEDIQAQLARLEKQCARREVVCAICNSSTSIIVTEKGSTFLKCNNACRFPWQILKQAGQTHIAAHHNLEDRFHSNKGGAIPLCPRHPEIAALMFVEKYIDKETAPTKGHLFFICTNPQKHGGPCMKANGGRWSVVADVRGKGELACKERVTLENLLALDGALRKKRNDDAKNSVANMMEETEKDFEFGVGIFEH